MKFEVTVKKVEEGRGCFSTVLWLLLGALLIAIISASAK